MSGVGLASLLNETATSGISTASELTSDPGRQQQAPGRQQESRTRPAPAAGGKSNGDAAAAAAEAAASLPHTEAGALPKHPAAQPGSQGQHPNAADPLEESVAALQRRHLAEAEPAPRADPAQTGADKPGSRQAAGPLAAAAAPAAQSSPKAQQAPAGKAAGSHSSPVSPRARHSVWPLAPTWHRHKSPEAQPRPAQLVSQPSSWPDSPAAHDAAHLMSSSPSHRARPQQQAAAATATSTKHAAAQPAQGGEQGGSPGGPAGRQVPASPAASSSSDAWEMVQGTSQVSTLHTGAAPKSASCAFPIIQTLQGCTTHLLSGHLAALSASSQNRVNMQVRVRVRLKCYLLAGCAYPAYVHLRTLILAWTLQSVWCPPVEHGPQGKHETRPLNTGVQLQAKERG